MSVRLTKKETIEAVDGMKSPGLRTAAKLIYAHRGGQNRRTSDAFGRKHPSRAVSQQEKEKMKAFYTDGLSFRAIEAVFGLIPASGMDAYRCVTTTRVSRKPKEKKARKVAKKVVTQAKIVPASVAPSVTPEVALVAVAAPVAVPTPAPEPVFVPEIGGLGATIANEAAKSEAVSV